jgi:hypothetical protein
MHHKNSRRLRPDFPLRKTFPTFEISNLLLDLDAEGVSGVRAFDDALDGVPEPDSAPKERELQAVKERVADFEKKYQNTDSSFKSISADKFNPFHISDFDILSVALLDTSNPTNTTTDSFSNGGNGTSRANMLDSVLNRNGVPHIVRDDTSKTMTYMLRRQSQSYNSSLAHGDEGLLERSLDTCSTFSELERLVTRTTQTPHGRRMISKLNSKLQTCVNILGRDVKRIQVLSFLNNLILNLEQDHSRIRADLYDNAIWAALECQAITTAHHYIEKRVKNWGQLNDEVIKSILNKLLQTSIASNSLIVSEIELDPSDRLTALFSLLTGYAPGEDQPRISLRSLINSTKDHAVRVHYIECLARLGAFRTIWHERHTTGFGSLTTRLGTGKGHGNVENPDSFGPVLYSALASNSGMKTFAKLPEFANATGQYEDDCQLDMVAISRSAEILALPQKAKGLDVSPTFGKDEARLCDIFEEKQIQKAILALQAFLVQKNAFS